MPLKKVLEMLADSNDKQLIDRIQKRLELYEQKKPYITP